MAHHYLAASWFSLSTSQVSWSALYKHLFCPCVREVFGWVWYYPLLPSYLPTPSVFRHTPPLPPHLSFLVEALEVL